MRILTIAPHPDDETLGCGGTLLKHKANGDLISWLIVTRGTEPQWPLELLDRKELEIAKVAEAYGFEQVYRANLPTIKLDSLPLEEVIGAIRDAVSETAPDLVYLNHSGDVHSDHRVIFEATMSALKPFNSGQHGVKRILSYEVPSSTDAMPPSQSRSFVPNSFSNITAHIDQKLDIMNLYQTEIQEYPLPRSLDSIRALARYRGATIGAEFAEAFVLVREVD